MERKISVRMVILIVKDVSFLIYKTDVWETTGTTALI